jgi:hypothetical protein
MEHSAEYDLEVMVRPSLDRVIQALRESDAAIFYGHGRAGVIHLGEEDLATENLARVSDGRQKPLDFVHIACCDTCLDRGWVEAWLRTTRVLKGYDTVTYRPLDPFRIPKPKTYLA